MLYAALGLVACVYRFKNAKGEFLARSHTISSNKALSSTS